MANRRLPWTGPLIGQQRRRRRELWEMVSSYAGSQTHAVLHYGQHQRVHCKILSVQDSLVEIRRSDRRERCWIPLLQVSRIVID